nr:Shedu immune nuclease family protein [uncultured Draconibacterium sp.]
MIEIKKKRNLLLAVYYSDIGNPDWPDEKFKANETFQLKGVYSVNHNKLHQKIQENGNFDTEYQFIIGKLKGEYYKIKKSVFNLKNDFYLHREIELSDKHFYAPDKISILKQIDTKVNGSVYIGGEKEDILPYQEFERLIKLFPNAYEIKIYRDARVTSIINEYFENLKDYEEIYKTYLNKKHTRQENTLIKTFKDSEIEKYETIHEKLDSMLNSEISYSEKTWQNEIIQIIQLLFPKYISVFKEVVFKDIYNNKMRRLDFGLVDFMGNLDIAEIKIPFDKNIISKNKYRENHIPNRDLSGTIMQIEKYIFYLNKTGIKGEQELTKKYKKELPEGLKVKIINPKGIIIMGRDKYIEDSQKNDFEIIKREYKNVIDIFTYDDLLSRLDLIIKQLKTI